MTQMTQIQTRSSRRFEMLWFGPWAIGVMLMTAVLVNASDYSFLVPLRDVRVAAHQQVVAQSAPSPARYRILVPVVLEVPIRILAKVMPYDKAFGRVYAVFYFVALVTLLAMLVYELSLWFTLEQAMVGALLVGSTIRMALRQGEYLDLSSIPLTSVFAPHSLLEPIFVAGTVILALTRNNWWIAAVLVLATLNSEAAAFLPLVYLAVRGVSAQSLKTTIGLAAIWIAIAVGIRFVVGVSEPSGTPAELWRENLAHLPATLINIALFIGPLWLLAALGVKRAPSPVRRASVLVPIYLGAVAIAGLWWDVRLLMGLYPILIPLVIAALFAPRSAVPAASHVGAVT
jgi:hypothetical protein